MIFICTHHDNPLREVSRSTASTTRVQHGNMLDVCAQVFLPSLAIEDPADGRKVKLEADEEGEAAEEGAEGVEAQEAPPPEEVEEAPDEEVSRASPDHLCLEIGTPLFVAIRENITEQKL